MTKFGVTGIVSATKIIGIFEADTKEDAHRIAKESSDCEINLCHHCEDECLGATIIKLTAEEI